MKTTLLLAAVYNIGSGLGLVLLLDTLGPWLHFEDSGNMLFRFFMGGTAVVFGLAYAFISSSYDRNRRILTCGTALKYWAFLISL